MSIESFVWGGGFNIMFSIVFILIFSVMVVTLIKNIQQWNKNNHSPKLTVVARVVTKRTQISHHHHHNAGDATGAHGSHTTSSTSYYVTFQVESGDRMELKVSNFEYGMLVEGDNGRLSFQGTRYLGFERQ